MKRSLSAKGFALTTSIRTAVREKITARIEPLLKRHAADAVRCEVDLLLETKHHKKGEVWRADVSLALPGTVLRATEPGSTIFEAIDAVADEIVRELKKTKEKAKTLETRGARSIKKRVRKGSLA